MHLLLDKPCEAAKKVQVLAYDCQVQSTMDEQRGGCASSGLTWFESMG